ncbi:Nuclear RNA binding protein B [Entamoeba marina]
MSLNHLSSFDTIAVKSMMFAMLTDASIPNVNLVNYYKNVFSELSTFLDVLWALLYPLNPQTKLVIEQMYLVQRYPLLSQIKGFSDFCNKLRGINDSYDSYTKQLGSMCYMDLFHSLAKPISFFDHDRIAKNIFDNFLKEIDYKYPTNTARQLVFNLNFKSMKNTISSPVSITTIDKCMEENDGKKNLLSASPDSNSTHSHPSSTFNTPLNRLNTFHQQPQSSTNCHLSVEQQHQPITQSLSKDNESISLKKSDVQLTPLIPNGIEVDISEVKYQYGIVETIEELVNDVQRQLYSGHIFKDKEEVIGLITELKGLLG